MTTQDEQLVVRTDGVIIGLSRPGERYWLYISKEDKRFYARFRHLRGKRVFPYGKYLPICNGLLEYYAQNAERFRPEQVTAPETGKPQPKTEDTTSTEGQSLKVNCENCYLRVSEQCSSIRGIVCEDFRPKIVLSKAETDAWPAYGDATCSREDYWQRYYRNQST